MILKSLTLQNFKAVGEEPVTIDFKPITLLFGPNSSGKSTIIQALHYAREIFTRNNTDPRKTQGGGKSVDLGGFHTLVHNHNLNRSVRMRFDFDIETMAECPADHYLSGIDSEAELWNYVYFQQFWIEIAVRWNSWLNVPVVRRYEVGLDGSLLGRIETSDDGRHVGLSYLNWSHPNLAPVEQDTEDSAYDKDPRLKDLIPSSVRPQYLESNSGGALAVGARKSALPDWGKELGLADEFFLDSPSVEEWTPEVAEVYWDSVNTMHSFLSALIVGPGNFLMQYLEEFSYLGPLREVLPRNYEPEIPVDRSRWAGGTAAWDILHSADDKLLQEVNSWLSDEDKLNTGYAVKRRHYRELEEGSPLEIAVDQGRLIDDIEFIRNEIDSLPVKTHLSLKKGDVDLPLLSQDVGVGVSQVIPVVVLALTAGEEGVVAIEQPELHVHPAIQVNLADLFISQIGLKKQLIFLLETHSEHLILRMMRRIRETSESGKHPLELWPRGLAVDQLSVVFLDQTEDGQLQAYPIRIDEDGDFKDRWPKGFFEERIDELM